MGRIRIVWRCGDCGAAAPKWVGQCGACGEWNTLFEDVETDEMPKPRTDHDADVNPVELSAVDVGTSPSWPTSIEEVDRVLGGGLVPGSVTVVGGEPGIGKSTLLLQLVGQLARSGRRTLVMSAEESVEQVKLRARRLGVLEKGVWLASETTLAATLSAIRRVEPEVVVVDSIQTVFDPELGSVPGSITQVRGCTHALVSVAKHNNIATIIVGHVTKEGALAGPRVLEHLVDTVLSFEGDRHHGLRMLRALKHRFGPTGELGLFEMTEEGLVGLADPSGLFLADRRPGTPGTMVVPALDGTRPLMVEVQALVAPTRAQIPRRTAQGVDGGRVSLLCAVLERRASYPYKGQEVHVSTVGGVRLSEPATDLGIAMALVSARIDKAIDLDICAVGEVGLAGEIRNVAHLPRRLAEASRLGFSTAIVPFNCPAVTEDIKLIRVSTLQEAVAAVGIEPRYRAEQRQKVRDAQSRRSTANFKPSLEVIKR